MAKQEQAPGKKAGVAERGARFMRNINIVGAVALGGAAVVFPAAAVPLAALAAVDAAQAGGFEMARRFAAKKGRKNKQK